MYTFPQRKIARAKLNVAMKTRLLGIADARIAGLQAQLDVRRRERQAIQDQVDKAKCILEQLENRYMNVEGSKINEPITAKFVELNTNKSGWLRVEYSQSHS